MGRARVPARREAVPEANGVFSPLIRGKASGFGNDGSRGRDPSRHWAPQSPPRYRAVLNSRSLICVNLQPARHSPASAGRRLVHLRFRFFPCPFAITQANETQQQPEDGLTTLTCPLAGPRISRP